MNHNIDDKRFRNATNTGSKSVFNRFISVANCGNAAIDNNVELNLKKNNGQQYLPDRS